MLHGVADNPEASRYELVENGHTSFLNYRKEGNTLTITWVEAPEALRGTGAAGRIVESVANEARDKGWNIIPVCGYAASWLKRNSGVAGNVNAPRSI